jgi:hypothetical protein
MLFLEADVAFAERQPEERARVLSALPGAVDGNRGVTLVLSGDPGLLGDAISSTTGLAECFAGHVPFEGYTNAELTELAARYLTSRGYALQEGTREALTGIFGEAPEGTGAWEAHRLAGYLGEFASGPVITKADLVRLADSAEPAQMAVRA